MNNFGDYITANEAFEMNKDNDGEIITLLEFIDRSKMGGTCGACESDDVWLYGGTGMCFSCQTGELDASEDYELIKYNGQW